MNKRWGYVVLLALFLTACNPEPEEKIIMVQSAQMSDKLPLVPFVNIVFQKEEMLVCNLGTGFYVFEKEENDYILGGSVDVKKTIENVAEEEYLWGTAHEFFVPVEVGIVITPVYEGESNPGESIKIQKADARYFYSYEDKRMRLLTEKEKRDFDEQNVSVDLLKDYETFQQETKELAEKQESVKKKIQSFLEPEEWVYEIEAFSDQPMKYGVIYDTESQVEDDTVYYLIYDQEKDIWDVYELDFK